MFERNRIDNAVNTRQTGVAAELTLEGGEVLAGKLVVGSGRSVIEALNGAAAFFEFEPYEGERMLIAKSAIRTVKLVEVPGGGHFKARLREVEGFEPGEVLGLAPGASIEEARHAYHRLAKSYHPDRWASAGLPSEVNDYLAAIARRINIAFAALERAEEARIRGAARAGLKPQPSRARV